MPQNNNILQWLSLVGAIWLQSINGTNSNFPAYSSQLKQLLSLSQLQLNNLAFASDAGKLFGWISGVAAVHLPLWLVLLIGSTLGLIGYGFQYLFVTQTISHLSYAHIFLLTVLAGNSICWINTVCYVVTIQNFPLDRQVAVGITSSYLGLSAKLYTSAVNAIETSSPNKRAKLYLLFNSIFPLLACVITSPAVREIDDHVEKSSSRRRTRGGFVFMFVVTIVTGCYAVLGSLDLSKLKTLLPPVKNLIGIVICLLAPLVIPLGEKIRGFVEEKRLMNRVKKVHNSTSIEEVSSRLENGAVIKEEEGRQLSDDDEIHHEFGVKEEIGAKLMLQRVDFWLYFFVYFSGATLGLVFLNNLGQIAESRGCSGTSSLVSLSSSFGFFGRLIPSLFDYFFSRSKYMIPSPASIAALMAPMAGAFMLLLNKSNIALYTSTAVIGVCSGAITSISVATTTELFGTKHFSVNHNIVVANIPIGSFLFGYLAALVYHNHKEGNNAYDGKCMGMACYRSTFILWGSFCLFGTFLALILYARTRKFYSQRY